MNAINNIGMFLIQTLFDLYIFVVILRLVLEAVHAHYYNPVVQMVVKLTNPIVKPLQKLLPYFHTISLGVLLLLVLLEISKILIISLILFHAIPNILTVIISSIADLLNKFLNFYFYAIIIRAIMSWLAPAQQSPILLLLYQITEPLLQPIRRIVPPLAGFDLSPLFAIIILQVLSILLMNSIAAWI